MVAPGEGACMVAPGGCVWLLLGGMHGCLGGYMVALGGVVDPGGIHGFAVGRGCAWLLLGGHAWLLLGGHVWLLGGALFLLGACMVAPGGHAWLIQGACVVAWGVWLLQGVACMIDSGGGHVWLIWRGMHGCSGGVCMVAPGGCVVSPRGGMRGCSEGVCVGYDEIHRYGQ